MPCRMQTAASYRAPCQGRRRRPGLRTARSCRSLPPAIYTAFQKHATELVAVSVYLSGTFRGNFAIKLPSCRRSHRTLNVSLLKYECCNHQACLGARSQIHPINQSGIFKMLRYKLRSDIMFMTGSDCGDRRENRVWFHRLATSQDSVEQIRCNQLTELSDHRYLGSRADGAPFTHYSHCCRR